MSRFSPRKSYECPHCTAHFSQCGVASFNNFGTTRWSDGFDNNWILLADRKFGRCPHCNKQIWLNDCATVPTIHRPSPPPDQPSTPEPSSLFQRLSAWLSRSRTQEDLLSQMLALSKRNDSDHMITPELDDYQEAIATQPLSPEREMHLRKRMLWLSNDHQRYPHRQPKLSAIERENNLLAIAALCSGQDDQRDWCLHGEVLRLLGRFEDALDVLNQGKDFDSESAKAISEFALQSQDQVQVIWRSEPPF